jgi:ketosteroid isomerase-like protein
MEKVTAGWLRGSRADGGDAASRVSTGSWLGAVMSNPNSEQQSDEQQILALHEAGDKALMSADLAVLAQIFADDYVQYNESGKAFTKQDVLNNFRTGAIRYPSIVSTGRQIRVFGDTAVVHGSESDEVEAGGNRFTVRYVYLDVLRKCRGEWKLVASQLARPMEK